MTSKVEKKEKSGAAGHEGKKTPKSDMLMSENMEQELVSEHTEHHRGDNKKDFYRKKVTHRPDKS